jgi:hypothetical protein
MLGCTGIPEYGSIKAGKRQILEFQPLNLTYTAKAA